MALATNNLGIARFLSDDNMEMLRGIMYTKQAEKGTYLYWEGDSADKLYYIIKGRVRLTKTMDTGKSFTLYLYQDGDLFGQLDPFQDSLHDFSAEVIEDSRIGMIQRKDLEVLLWQHGDLAIQFMKWMGLTHRVTQSKFRDLMMFGKTGALCSLLIRLSNTYGVPQEGSEIWIDLKINNTEMAEMIGTARESVNRILTDLRKADVIDYVDGHLVIKDLSYLRDVCHCEQCPMEVCRM
ncbi:Crp/Fnr family transcriptional regulator [Xylanibacillus composti]|nr:Crp/Fnr family transcriptional regulator [Xylanibacillus composti]MDT9726968.1 Crp/Fnr family transcriptional regulator [Xylanibacillus composti]